MKITKAQLKRLIKEELGGMQEGVGTYVDGAKLKPEIWNMVSRLGMEIAGMEEYKPEDRSSAQADTYVRPVHQDITNTILNAIEPYLTDETYKS